MVVKTRAVEGNVSTPSSQSLNTANPDVVTLCPQPRHHGSGYAVCRAQPAVRQRLHKAREEMHKARQKR